MPAWMTSEIRTLREMFPTHGIDEVADAIPRHTKVAINARAYSENLRPRRDPVKVCTKIDVIGVMATHRRATGVSMVKTAQRMAKDRAVAYRWENGNVNPRLESFLDYAAAIGLRVTVENAATGETVWRQGETLEGNSK